MLTSALALFGCGGSVKTLRTPSKEKDPNDYTLTESSTVWGTDRFCSTCKATTGHREYMSQVCNTCGTISNTIIPFDYRSYRQIYKDKKWVWQYKYVNNKFEILERPVHSEEGLRKD